ncbi:MAG: hypothetical protein Q8L88_15065 [Bacteroidota bacterium]|nr:hypothetical protein [Bacteroidota bacterium]
MIFWFSSSISIAQIMFEKGYNLSGSSSSSIPLSNSITDISIQGDTIWLGTGKGLSRSIDGGKSWKNYYDTPEFGNEDISALAVRGKDVWVALARSVEIDGQSLPEGRGLRYSSDGGTSWKKIAQPVDQNNVDTIFWGRNIVRALGVTTTIQNITYDIAFSDSAVWIASWAGMIRTSTDSGQTWNRVVIPPDKRDSISISDSISFDLSPSSGKLGLTGSLNHSGFSLLVENNDTIWIGTAGGINKTTNGGLSWKKFSKQKQTNPISGNFVVALGKQKTTTKEIIWAATINASDNTEKKGVSFSEDGGLNWKQVLIGEFTHNFGFKNEIVYAPTDNGVFRSEDFGSSWSQTGAIYDKTNRQRYTQSKFFSAASAYDSIVWLGGSDGLVKTFDNAAYFFGSSWTISHASQPVSSQTETYAYPNPFAPDDEIVRIHYSTGKTYAANVTLRIFDFGMNLVDTPVQNALREANREHDEIWSGKTHNGTYVTNGVYFYQLVIEDDEPLWGKILVIQ